MFEFFRAGWIRHSLLWAVVIGGAILARSAQANVYATQVKLDGGTTNITAQPGQTISISYFLNEPASLGVTIAVLSGTRVVRSITVPPGTVGSLSGPNSVIWDGLDNRSNTLASGSYSVRITPASSGYSDWHQLTLNEDPNTWVWGGRGIAVDQNVTSPYFGTVFVANAVRGPSPETTPGDAIGILKFNPDATAPAEGILSTGGYSWPDSPLGLGPRKLEVSADDRVYVSDLQDPAGKLVSWDPSFSTNSFLEVLQAGNKPAGTQLSGLAIAGRGTNAVLWMTDTLSTMGVLKWPLSTNGAPGPTDAGLSVVGLAGTNTGLVIPPVDVAVDAAGNIYVCQSITAAGDPAPRVFKFPAYNPLTNNGTPEITASWVAGANDDTCGGATDIAIDPTGTYLAVSFEGILAGGFPLNGNTKIFRTADGGLVTSVDLGMIILGNDSHQDTACTWDLAGNLYYVDNEWGQWRAVSPPGPNQFTTLAVPVIEVVGSVITPPQITGFTVSNGWAMITFSAGASDTPGMFEVVSAPVAGGPYARVSGALISLVSPGVFRASFAQSGSIQFYDVRRAESPPPQQPVITGISLSSGSVVLDFTAGPSDTPGMFEVVSAPVAGGPYARVSGAVITLVSPGVFRASFPQSGLIQFYDVRRAGSPPPQEPVITGISLNSGNVVLNFTGASADSASAFKLLGANSPGGNFTEVSGSSIELISPGAFRATAPASRPIQFYRIQR